MTPEEEIAAYEYMDALEREEYAFLQFMIRIGAWGKP